MGETTQGALDVLTTTWTWLSGRTSTVVSTITSSPLLLLGIGFWTVGGAIGIAYRLIRG